MDDPWPGGLPVAMHAEVKVDISSDKKAVIAIAVLAVVFGVGAYVIVKSQVPTKMSEPVQLPPPPPAPPPPPPEPTLLQKLNKAGTLLEALGVMDGTFSDTVNEPDAAAAVLALWCRSRLNWAELTKLPRTTHAKVMKDSELERGRGLCVSGSIIEIAADRSAGDPVYTGLLSTDDFDIIHYLAVGSSGELVQRSRARFCGVVTGRFSYSNAGGGTSHSVNVVGMFDLPENKVSP